MLSQPWHDILITNNPKMIYNVAEMEKFVPGGVIEAANND